MKKEELYQFIGNIKDPVLDYGKILSNVHFTHYHLMEKYKRLLTRYDLTPAQSYVLGILRYYSPADAALEDIKEMILEPNSDVSRTVNRLVGKGFAEKVSNNSNRRKVSIKITKLGKKILQEIETDKTFGTLTQAFSLKEAQTLIKLLAKFRK